jgi:hypothetical protein
MKRLKGLRPVSQDQNNAQAYWGDLNPEGLEARFWLASRSVFLSVRAFWDMSPRSRHYNCWVPEEYLNACCLYECGSGQLLAMMDESNNYRFANIWRNAQKNPFLRVIGHWERNRVLSPPVLKPTDIGTFKQYDGFHRLLVAFAAQPGPIPFFAVLGGNPLGIRRCAESAPKV